MRKTLFLTIASIAACALVLAGCSQSALGLAKQACSHVHSSIAAYEAAMHASGEKMRNRELHTAKVDIQEAEPIAAAATSSDGRWNALMTTLNEIGQVDEGHLISALQAQCAVADGGQPNLR